MKLWMWGAASVASVVLISILFSPPHQSSPPFPPKDGSAEVSVAEGGEGERSSGEGGLPVLGEIPDFTLTERSGGAIRRSDLNGQVLIADFVFTRCAGVCPLMSAKMKRLQTIFQDEAGIRFISFSADPDYDKPEVLREYAERYEADPEKWLFLTGDKEKIYELSLQHFHLGIGEIPEEAQELRGQTIRHSSKFVLLDPKGQIRGYYDTEGPSGFKQLIQDAGVLLGRGR